MLLKLAPWPVVEDAASGDGDAACKFGDTAWRSRELPLLSKLTGLKEEEEAAGEAPVRVMLEKVMLQPAGAVS